MPTATETIASNEISPKPKRRKFTASYKASIVAKANACTKPGEVAALLREEGLYSSHLAEWRKAAKVGTIAALGKKRGPKKKRSEAEIRAEKAERENAELKKKLKFAEEVIAVQKKVSELLGIQLETPPKPPWLEDD